MKHVLEFELTDQEFRRSWLAEYYRRPGLRWFRILAGPVVFVVGAIMLRDAHDVGGRAAGSIALVYGVFHALRPFFLSALVMRRRKKLGRRKYQVTLDDAGIGIADGKQTSRLPWSDITASGSGDGYLWYEIRKSARAILPFRAMSDRDAIIETFRERGHYRA